MHRALEVREIVDTILTYLVEVGIEPYWVLQVGLASRGFFEAAMDVIWGLDYRSIRPSRLLRPLMASGAIGWNVERDPNIARMRRMKILVRNTAPRFLETKRPLNPTDWERFDLYAKRVRSLWMDCQVGDKAFKFIAVDYASRGSPFPQLQDLTIDAEQTLGDDTLLACTQLFVPSLSSFSIRPGRGPKAVSAAILDVWFRALALRCLHLAKLNIDVGNTKDKHDESHHLVVSRAQRSFEQLLPNLTSLRHVEIRMEGTLFDIITHLAALPCLENLILYSDARSTLPHLAPRQGEVALVHQFPNLRILNLNIKNDDSMYPFVYSGRSSRSSTFDSSKYDFMYIQQIAQVAQSSPLQEICLGWQAEGPGSVQEALTTYATPSRGVVGGLETIKLGCKLSSLTIPYADSRITFNHLRPIFNPCYSHLTTLSIGYSVLFDLDDDNVAAIVQRLPHLVLLRLGSSSEKPGDDWPAPRVTVRSLITLARVCCDLKYLGLSVNLSGLVRFENMDDEPSISKLSCWDALYSKVGRTKAVALTLASLFPNLTEIDGDNVPSFRGQRRLGTVESFLQNVSDLQDMEEDPISLDGSFLESCWEDFTDELASHD